MLTAMLNYAGFEANPVLLTTRSSKIGLFPSRNVFNYVIASVQLENEIILLDATSKSSTLNILPFRTLNWTGRLIKKDGSSKLIDLTPKKHSVESNSIMVELDGEGKLTGKLKKQFLDYNAYGFREGYGKLSEESRVEKLENAYTGIEIGEYRLGGKNDLTKPVIEDYEFIHKNGVDIIGDKIYISPMLFLTHDENPFKQDNRE
jgi:hypothetical protein